MSNQDDIRKEVSRAYARAVRAPAPASGCCKGAATGLAGYSSSELDALPPDAAVNAFGCGNPVAFSEIREGDVVVDLGSGAGIDLLLAGRKVGPKGRVIGIDMTDEMIARAEANVREAGMDNIEVRKGIIEDLPVEDASVDWVISNCVINLSPEKPRVFSEIARVLKPGGRMLVSDIVVQDLPEWIRRSAELYSACVAGAVSEKEYMEGLRAAGMEDVEVRGSLAYDADQLAAMASFEAGTESAACCGQGLAREVLKQVLEDAAGRIRSVKIYARKPAVPKRNPDAGTRGGKSCG